MSTNPNIRNISTGFNVPCALFDLMMERCRALGISRQEWLNRIVAKEFKVAKSPRLCKDKGMKTDADIYKNAGRRRLEREVNAAYEARMTTRKRPSSPSDPVPSPIGPKSPPPLKTGAT